MVPDTGRALEAGGPHPSHQTSERRSANPSRPGSVAPKSRGRLPRSDAMVERQFAGHRVDALIRPGTPEDWPWIAQTWAESLRGSGREQRKVEPSRWSAYWYSLIRETLVQPGVRVMVAADDRAPEMVLSYIVATPEVLHMAYTRRAERRQGLVKRLWPHVLRELQGALVTCWTQDVATWALERYGLRYVPLYMLYPESTHGEAAGDFRSTPVAR